MQEIQLQPSDLLLVLMKNDSIGHRNAFFQDELTKSCVLLNNLFSPLLY